MPASKSQRLVHFATTRWSLVAAAGDVHAPEQEKALAELCQRYWPPLYAFLRQQGHNRHDAKDLTQAFILDLLKRNAWAVASRERGLFRSFLLGCLKHFLSHEREKQQAGKRGGSRMAFSLHQSEGEKAYQAVSQEPSPEVLFERAWLNALIDHVWKQFLRSLSSELDQNEIHKIMPYILGAEPPYADLAQASNTTPAAMRQRISRYRRKYRQILLEEIGDTVADSSQIDQEVRYLFSIASRNP